MLLSLYWKKSKSKEMCYAAFNNYMKRFLNFKRDNTERETPQAATVCTIPTIILCFELPENLSNQFHRKLKM